MDVRMFWTRYKLTHLSLREPQVGGQLCLASDRDVAAVVELLLKLQPLMVAVHDAVLVLCARLACNRAPTVNKDGDRERHVSINCRALCTGM